MYLQLVFAPVIGILISTSCSQEQPETGRPGIEPTAFSFFATVYYHFIFITVKDKIFELKYEKLLHFLHECLNSIGKLTQ